MKDKSLIKQRFLKSLNTYDNNAYIQKHSAEKLVKLLTGGITAKSLKPEQEQEF